MDNRIADLAVGVHMSYYNSYIYLCGVLISYQVTYEREMELQDSGRSFFELAAMTVRALLSSGRGG